MAPICARNCATRSCCCCATRPVAAWASSRGKSPSTSAPAPIAAIICNHSRRVLLVTLRLTVHLPSRVAVQYVRGALEGKVHLPPCRSESPHPLPPPFGSPHPPYPLSLRERGSPVQPPGSTCANRNNMLFGAVFRFGGRNSRREHGSYGSTPACPARPEVYASARAATRANVY